MSEYKHGVETSRKEAEPQSPAKSPENAVVVIGTAPVNTAEFPAVNVPVLASRRSDAVAAMGMSEEFDHYTILHSIYAQFNKFGAAPIVFINVLDPGNPAHQTGVASRKMPVESKQVVIEETGILLDKLQVSDQDEVLSEGKDYVASFDDSGYVVIAATDAGQMANLSQITVTYSKLNPEGVTEADIIGGVDENGVRTGLELLDEIYPRFGVVPAILIAPGFSKKASVAAALEAKAQLIYGLTNGIAIVDLDSGASGATKKEDVAKQKAKTVVPSRWNVAVWPMVQVDGHQIWQSAQAAALLQATAAKNKGIPSESPDNLEYKIDGLCLEDGSPVRMTMDDVNDYLNRYGICSALKLPEWKFWGSSTAAYPASDKTLDRWIKSVTMLNFMENRFKLDYASSIGRNASVKKINDIVDQFNLFLNSLIPDHLSGAEMVFDIDKNDESAIKENHYKFHTRYADWGSLEFIEHEFEYDAAIQMDALKGGFE